MHVCVLSCFSCVQLCGTLWPVLTRLLCPWDSPGKNIGVGCHDLLQEVFLTQVSNLHLVFPVLAGGIYTTSGTWEAHNRILLSHKKE